MNETGPLDPNQAQDWIDQERERLRSAGEQADGEAWINSLREWLKLLRPSSAGVFGGSSADELNQTLRGLGAAQQGIFDALIKLPQLGLTASYFEPWTKLQAADAEFRKVEERFREALIEVHLNALNELESRLKSRKGKPANERELYDLWIECGEAVFARVAHSAEYAQLQGSMSNAAVHRVNAQKKVLEQIARMFDLPTRSELNSVHQQLRAMRRELELLKPASPNKVRAKSKQSQQRPGAVSKSSRRKARKVSR
jgi:class III poly(R)-hydroxyalkanoic acid synthase PhaE subunit